MSNRTPQKTGVGQLVIVSASYGSHTRLMDVTDVIRQQIENGRIDYKVSWKVLGDPHPHRDKSLRVTYRVGNGALQIVAVYDQVRLRIPK